MTISDYKKVFKQLKNNPVKLKKFLKHNKPKARRFGKSTKKCKRCGTSRGYIGKYHLGYCRRCFRENARELGFQKYR